MSSTGLKFAGTAVNVDRGGATDWFSPQNVCSDVGTSATTNVPCDYLVCTNFGFTVPSSATIRGITLTINAAESGSAGTAVTAQLCSDATPTLIGTSKAQSANTISGTTLTVYTLGGTTDVWGTSGLTGSDVNSSTFGIAIWSTDTTNALEIGYVKLTIEYNDNVSVGKGTLTLTAAAPTVSKVEAGPTESVPSASLTLSSAAPTLRFERNVSVPKGTLSLAAAAPAATSAINVPVDWTSLSLSTSAPTVEKSAAADRMRVSWVALKVPQSASRTISVPKATLSLTAFAPTTDYPRSVTVPQGTLTLSTVVPTITSTIQVSVDKGELTLTGVAPTYTRSVGIPVGGTALTLAAAAPTISTALQFSVGKATLTLQSAAPSKTIVAPGEKSVPSTSLSLAAAAPTVSKALISTVGKATLTLASAAPQISVSPNVSVPKATLTLAGYAPTAEKLLNISVDPAQLIITGYTATVEGGVGVVTETRRQEAGQPSRKASRRRKKPVLVEIDGQQFVVSSEFEAEQLVETAAKAAVEIAEKQAQEIIQKREKKAKKARLNTSPLQLDVPEISVRPVDDGSIDQQWLSDVNDRMNRIREAFTEVAQRYETALLLKYQQELDEEDALVALLLTI